MTDAPPSRPSLLRPIVGAAAVYFAIVFGAGLLLGPLRVLWVEPWLGTTLAVLLETPILVLAMALGARIAPRVARLSGGWGAHLSYGVLALLMQQIADLAVGFGLRGMTLNEQWAYLATPPGYIYAASLLVFALLPLAVHWRSTRSKA